MSEKPKKPDFFNIAKERIVLIDGAMGTQIQVRDPGHEDFGGNHLDGCNEILNLTRPQWIREIHASYFDAGADAVETNTFGAMPLVLNEFDIANKAYDINFAAARIAQEVAASYDRPTYVLGSVGPGTKLVTLGHVSYDVMYQSYCVQMQGLIDGGADVLLLETAQDIQQLKIAARAAIDIMHQRQKVLPVMAQVTVELTGTTLVGSDIQAILAVMEMFPIGALGLNCATGPDEMRSHIEYLSQSSPFIISCIPNAGLPENVRGKTVYPLGPDQFAAKVTELARTFGVGIVGGCCGTTPDHIRALHARLKTQGLTPNHAVYDNAVASLYSAVPLSLEPRPLFVGERTNANGSKLFRDCLAKDDFDAMVAIAKSQLKEGAHILDCCTAYVSRNEKRDMREFLQRLVTQVNIPIMIDSTEVDVIEESLKCIPGKAIVNSINFEDGEGKARQILGLCKTFGAAVVALTIDEDGMAKTSAKKLEIAERIYKLAHGEFGLKASDIIFDPLTFTLGSGDEEFRRSAIETLDAISAIKKTLPGVKTILGLSNVSFGLEPFSRKLLNSVMLYHAVEHGLDMAISNAAKIVPLFKLDETERVIFEDLIYDRRREGYDPLKEILARFSGRTGKAESKTESHALPLEKRLAQRIVEGDKIGIIPDLKEAMGSYPPLDIINNFLLDGMRIVGEKFGSGEMQLPFVLESAEAMKSAVAYLEPFMDKESAAVSKGKILLATVKGDVHDIGKNLVDIILSNNGFQVINLGIKQPIEAILEKYQTIKPDAIGLSGLLVKSTAIMRSDLEEMQRRQLAVPVILGGAALTRKFVEEDCQAVYGGQVFYAEDAFAGLRIMSGLKGLAPLPVKSAVTSDDGTTSTSEPNIAGSESGRPQVRGVRRSGDDTPLTSGGQSTWVRRPQSVPRPPFFGSQVITASLSELLSYLDEFALVRTRWQFVRGDLSEEAFKDVLEGKAKPILNTWRARSEREKLLQPQAVYGYFACQSDGEKLHVFKDEHSDQVLVTFDFPRQASGRRLCLADFYASKASGERDILPMQIVTMGARAAEFSQELYSAGKFSDYFYFHGLSTEMAEAFAEFLHARIRQELGIHKRDAKSKRQIFSQGYQGSRYSFGYPACPELSDNALLFKCLEPSRIGVTLTENFQMVPEQSTCAIIAWHPQARYFSV